jgi:putative nucleotidyltransferase with HDIG domain
MWESSVLRDGGVRPVTFTIESGVLNFRNPWRRLAANGVSSVFVMPLAGMEDTPGILVLADPDKNWKYEGLEADFQFLRNTLTAAMEHHLDEISLENNRRVTGDRFAGVITALCQVSELKDMSTSGHQRKVSALAEKIAVRLGLPGETALAVRYAGLAHDIGKLYIPAEILSKPSDLTPTEYELVKKHPEYGRDILSPLNFPWPLADIILQHHERIDGSGYPAGLKKDEICIEARILAAADSFDAMTSERPYREKMPTSRAMAEIRLLAGRAYDPDVVAALEALVAEDLDGSEK